MTPIPSRLRRCRRARTPTVLSGCALAVMSPVMLEYVVAPGDTVSEIAAEHGTTVDRVVRANDLPAGGDTIYAGDSLRLPAAHRTQAAPSHGDGGGRSVDDGRRIEWHRVGPGDTMTEIAVRYHAWTDELIAANGGTSALQVGERVRVPVVVAAARADRDEAARDDTARDDARDHDSDDQGAVPAARVRRLRHRLEGYPDPGRARVRRVITRVAAREGVDPDLALAVSWQEAGWQQHHVSADAAIGAMQVIPSSGAWAEDVLGRGLDLMRLRDNATAGVVLLAELTDAASTRRAVAGYYQGLAGVRAEGMYGDTRAYVANVLALKRAFDRGDYPH
jgi:N-acetylmuramoyl-L-alanine amidase